MRILLDECIPIDFRHVLAAAGQVETARTQQWPEAWKINLIERDNPRWADLYPGLLALPGNRLAGASGRMGPRDKPEDDT